MTSVVHMVFFDLGAPPHTVLAETAAMVTRIRREVPGLLELHFGNHEGGKMYDGYVDRSNGFNFALVSRHATAQDLAVYTAHPAHVEFANRLKSWAKRPAVAVDFVTGSKL